MAAPNSWRGSVNGRNWSRHLSFLVPMTALLHRQMRRSSGSNGYSDRTLPEWLASTIRSVPACRGRSTPIVESDSAHRRRNVSLTKLNTILAAKKWQPPQCPTTWKRNMTSTNDRRLSLSIGIHDKEWPHYGFCILPNIAVRSSRMCGVEFMTKGLFLYLLYNSLDSKYLRTSMCTKVKIGETCWYVKSTLYV